MTWLNSSLLIGERIIVLLLSFTSALLMARYAGAELFGLFSAIVSLGSLFLIFTQMGLNSVASKYFSLYPNSSAYYMQAALLIRLLFSTIAIPFAFLSGLFIWDLNKAILVALLVTLQIGNALNVTEFYFIAKHSVIKPLIPRLLIKLVCKTALILAIIFELPLSIWVALVGLEYLCIAFAYLLLLRQKQVHLHNVFSTTKNIRRGMYLLFHRGKWLALSSLAAIIYLKIDQVMLATMVGDKEVAYYAAAAKLSEFWYVLPVLVSNVLMPRLVELYKTQISHYWHLQRWLYFYSTVIASLVAILMMLLAKPLIILLFTDEYLPSVPILQIHILGCLFIFSRAFMSKWLVLSNHHKLSLYSHAFGALSNIFLNWFLIPIFGGIGAAIASVVSYCIASIGFMFFFKSTREYLLKILPKCFRPNS
nr:flippase [Pseudoalteromonas caenipelagi]